MCKIANVLHNLYHTQHGLHNFTTNAEHASHAPHTSHATHATHATHASQASHAPKSSSLISKKIEHGQVRCIYDIQTVQISYKHSFDYRKQKLADINVSPYIDENFYLSIIDQMKQFFEDKLISVIHLDAEHVYLYYNGECINTMINNMITWHDIT